MNANDTARNRKLAYAIGRQLVDHPNLCFGGVNTHEGMIMCLNDEVIVYEKHRLRISNEQKINLPESSTDAEIAKLADELVKRIGVTSDTRHVSFEIVDGALIWGIK